MSNISLIAVIAASRPNASTNLIGAAATGREVAAQYWRILCLRGDGNNVSFYNIDLRHAVGDATSHLEDVSGVSFIGTEFNGTYAPANGFDDSTGTRWAGLGLAGNWLGIDLGSGNASVLREVVADPYSEPMRMAVVQWSDDGTTWNHYALLQDNFTIIGETIGTADFTKTLDPDHIPVAAQTGLSYRYHRVLLLGGMDDNYTALNQIIFKNAADTDLPLTHGGTASASSDQGSYPASAAFTVAGGWASAVRAGGNWIKWDYGVGNAYPLEKADLVEWTRTSSDLAPTMAVFQGSNDDTNWDTLYISDYLDNWSGTDTKSFDFSS